MEKSAKTQGVVHGNASIVSKRCSHTLPCPSEDTLLIRVFRHILARENSSQGSGCPLQGALALDSQIAME